MFVLERFMMCDGDYSKDPTIQESPYFAIIHSLFNYLTRKGPYNLFRELRVSNVINCTRHLMTTVANTVVDVQP